jgi:glutathione S-transferase
MLDLKGLEVQEVKVLPGMQRVHLRLAGFRGGTVPALKLDGRRVQGSRQIARVLEQFQPEPSLFPSDPERRRLADEAERWGEEELQDVPRRIFRWGLAHHVELRRWLSSVSGLPAPGLVARLSGLNARYFANLVDADEATVRGDVDRLSGLLDQADRLIQDGVLTTDPPNAAALQVLSSIRSLDGFSDLHEHVSKHACADAAAHLFPDMPGPVPPFMPVEWLVGLG